MKISQYFIFFTLINKFMIFGFFSRISRHLSKSSYFQSFEKDSSKVESEKIEDLLSKLDLERDDSEIDIEFVHETAMDLSIEKAVKQLIDNGPATPVPDPVETFSEMYKSLKATPSKNRTEPLDPAKMLAQLFPTEQVGEPFDEVII